MCHPYPAADLIEIAKPLPFAERPDALKRLLHVDENPHQRPIKRNSTGCAVQENTRLPTGNKGNADLHTTINVEPTRRTNATRHIPRRA